MTHYDSHAKIFFFIALIVTLYLNAGCENKDKSNGSQLEPNIKENNETETNYTQTHDHILISLKDIEHLGPNATMKDVDHLITKGRFVWSGAIFPISAKEGGVYIVSLLPTNELPATPGDQVGSPKIYAIIYSSSYNDFLLGKGRHTYVYPKEMAGKLFTGFIPFNHDKWQMQD